MNLDEYKTMFSVEDTHWWYHALRAMVARALRSNVTGHSPRILDAGCGTGATLQMLAAQATPVGVDLMPEAVRFCRIRNQHLTAAASILHLPFPHETFDAVVSLDVLCHRSITDKRAPIREIHRVLRPGGILVLNLPAYQWLHSSHDIAVHTDTRFTKHSALALLRQCNFKPIQTTYWNSLLLPPIIATRIWRKHFPPNRSDLANPPARTANTIYKTILAAERAILKITPLPAGLSIFITAQK